MEEEDARAAATARDFAACLAQVWQRRPALLTARLIGSLAHGGFSRRYSDIDIAVISETGLSEQDLAALRTDAVAISPGLSAKLSIFWTDRHLSNGRFPPLDRVDYLDHGITLFARAMLAPPRPGLDEIRAYLCGRPFQAWAEVAARFAALPALAPQERKAYLRALLYPARFAYSFQTGRMASNDSAVEWLSDRALPGFDIALIAQALAIRRAAADPDDLFPARAQLPAQVAACAALMAARS